MKDQEFISCWWCTFLFWIIWGKKYLRGFTRVALQSHQDCCSDDIHKDCLQKEWKNDELVIAFCMLAFPLVFTLFVLKALYFWLQIMNVLLSDFFSLSLSLSQTRVLLFSFVWPIDWICPKHTCASDYADMFMSILIQFFSHFLKYIRGFFSPHPSHITIKVVTCNCISRNAVHHRTHSEVNAEIYGELSTNLFKLEKVGGNRTTQGFTFHSSIDPAMSLMNNMNKYDRFFLHTMPCLANSFDLLNKGQCVLTAHILLLSLFTLRLCLLVPSLNRQACRSSINYIKYCETSSSQEDLWMSQRLSA